MGARGPQPKPTAIRELEGNPGKRAMPKAEPKPRPAPKNWDPPAHLKGEARREWQRLAEPLRLQGVLTLNDRAAFAMYCTQWGRHEEAEWHIRHEPTMFVTKTGYRQVNPWLTISKQSAELALKLLAGFGLNPATRSRIVADLPPGAQPTAPEPETPDEPTMGAGTRFSGLMGKRPTH